MDGYLTLAANPEHCAHLQLDARARAALRLLLPAWHGLQLCGVHVRPVVRQLRGRPGRLEHGQDVLHSAAKRGCKAALWCALPGAGPAQPNGRNGGRLRPPDPGRNPGEVEAEEDTAASALLLKHEFLDGGADDVTLATRARCCWSPRSPR